MTEAALMEMVRKVPLSRKQELYDFARFLVDTYGDVKSDKKIEAFESEDEMLDFINDIGGEDLFFGTFVSDLWILLYLGFAIKVNIVRLCDTFLRFSSEIRRSVVVFPT